MSAIESYFIGSGRLKKVLSFLGQLKTYADSNKDRDLLSAASMAQSLLSESNYFVGIPSESYPTMYSGNELKFDSMDNGITIRTEMKAGELDRVITSLTEEAKRLRGKGDKMAETADLLVTVLSVMKTETYHGKTHQVASFDPLGERLGYFP